MQTNFSPAQRNEPAIADAESVIRKCVHCGFCTATCPTYVLLGDELDSPRGRIYLMKDMLENERAPTPQVVKHIDRCLSCLSCMTTCPSGVNYMHLIDTARAYIEKHYRRPLREQGVRRLLAAVMPHPARFRTAVRLARLGRPFAGLLGRVPMLAPIVALLELAPRKITRATVIDSKAVRARGRVILLQGCIESALRPTFRAAAVRLLNRAGYDVTFARDEGCCGALVHHMGREAESLDAARRNVNAWSEEITRGAISAIVVTASGCGTAVKDYGFMLRNDPAYAENASKIASLTKDISEFLDEVGLPKGEIQGVTIAYQAACSLQHGQKVTEAPRRLLEQAGYVVRIPEEAHLCCGSAGTYNVLQPAIAGQLGVRKAANIARLNAKAIATGNIGCAVQLERYSDTPVVHVVELLDWASGGPSPLGEAINETGATNERDDPAGRHSTARRR